jgi:uncharacterized protein (UPF0276 family)
MQFALNYSAPAAELLESGRIQFDLFKCPDWPDVIEKAARQRPVYIHFDLVAGQRGSSPPDLDAIDRTLQATGTHHVNTHIAARNQDLDDPEDIDAVVQHILADVMPLVTRFGADRVVAENVPYPDTDGDKPRAVVLPQVIKRVIYESGCGLLLDIGHARLTAEYLGIDTRDYITQLPVERLAELHITGVGLDPSGQRADHMPMTGEDWSLLEWALASIRRGMWGRPRLIACEYGGVGPTFEWRSSPAVILSDIPRMYSLIKALQMV